MVSIIIPAYNVQEYFRECLESVLAQSFHDIEVVIVNDGSTDNTRRIAEEFMMSDSRVTLINQENGGMSVARNVGLEQSCGDLIMFVDSDDCLLPGAISNLVEALESTGSDIAIGGFSYARHVTAASNNPVYTISPRDAVETILYQTKHSAFNNSVSGKIYHRCIIGQERFTPGLYFEDIDFFYRVFMRAGVIGVTESVVYFYRATPGSIMHVFSPKRADVLEITRRIELYFNDDPQLLAAAQDRRLSANFNIFALISCQPDRDKYKQISADCWDVIKKYRILALMNNKVRLKNKVGALLSYFGKTVFSILSRLNK